MRRRPLLPPRPSPSPDAALTLAALSGVAALLLLAHLSEPPLTPLSALPAEEGPRVAVEARVLAVTHGARARHLVLADDERRVEAFAPPGEGPERGDVVRGVGVVARLDRGLGLSLERLDVVEAALARPRSPAQLAQHPEAFDGARVLVRGEPREGALVGGGARVRLAGAPPPDEPGLWLAAGEFSYREREAAYVLRVEAWSPSSS